MTKISLIYYRLTLAIDRKCSFVPCTILFNSIFILRQYRYQFYWFFFIFFTHSHNMGKYFSSSAHFFRQFFPSRFIFKFISILAFVFSSASIRSQLVRLYSLATITHEITSRKRAKTSNMRTSRGRNGILFNYASFTHKIPFLILRLGRCDSKVESREK